MVILYNGSRIVSLRSDNRIVLKRLFAHPMSSLKVLPIGPNELKFLDGSLDLADEPAKVVPSLRRPSMEGNIGGTESHLTHFKFHEWYPQEADDEMPHSVLEVFRRWPMLEVAEFA